VECRPHQSTSSLLRLSYGPLHSGASTAVAGSLDTEKRKRDKPNVKPHPQLQGSCVGNLKGGGSKQVLPTVPCGMRHGARRGSLRVPADNGGGARVTRV
jgi:hypothetical protein